MAETIYVFSYIFLNIICSICITFCMYFSIFQFGTEQPNGVLSPREDYFFLLQHHTVAHSSFCGAEFSQAFPNLLWHVACLVVSSLFSIYVGSRDGETWWVQLPISLGYTISEQTPQSSGFSVFLPPFPQYSLSLGLGKLI